MGRHTMKFREQFIRRSGEIIVTADKRRKIGGAFAADKPLWLDFAQVRINV